MTSCQEFKTPLVWNRCFSLGIYCCDKTPQPKETCRGNGSFQLRVPHPSTSLREVITGTQTGMEPACRTQELTERSWRRAAY